MRKSGWYWLGTQTSEAQALEHSRVHHGPGYRVTVDGSESDKPFPGCIRVKVRWEIVDQAKVDAEHRRRHDPPTGLQRQAMAYLSEEQNW